MKIGILSDTHGSSLYFDKEMDVLGECDFISSRRRYTLSWT